MLPWWYWHKHYLKLGVQKKKLSLHVQTLSVWQLNAWLFYLLNVIWPIIVNIAHNVHKSRVCQRGIAWAPSKTLLLELRMWSWGMKHTYTCTHTEGGLAWHSARVWGWREEAFVSPHSLPTHTNTHTHRTHPPWVWRRVCFQYEGRGSGEVLGWVDECLLLTQEKQL